MKILVLSFIGLAALAHAAAVGEFDRATDVGKIALAGSSEFAADRREYRITGSGANIWGREDGFQFLSKQLTGDIAFTADITWPAPGKEGHRKACTMVRQGLEADDAYVDIAVHGDGLISFQYRKEKGGETFGVQMSIKAPATIKLERDGDVFTASVAKDGRTFQPIGAVELKLRDPVHVGLAVSAHNATVRETAVFSHVALANRVAKDGEKRVRETTLETLVVATGERRLVHRERSTFEAPNWSRDGRQFYVNRSGGIFTIPASGGEPRPVAMGAVDRANNDHGLSPDGRWLAVSSNRPEVGSQIWIVAAAGGEPRLVTPQGPSYWHGWSPDGATLAYCARRGGNFDIYTVPAAGGPERRLTTADGLDDGCDYTPDGTKIYFNSERSGVMQIWRMNPDGSAQEQVTTDPNFADWFPHPSPDGKWIAFLSFDKAVKGHPANQNVVLRLLPLGGGKPKVIATLFGGQGTINVPSWSPDSTQLAFVSYRHVLP